MWLHFDICPLFSHTVDILLQAFLTAYHEIFQTLAVDRGVLFLKPDLDLGCDRTVRWKSPMSGDISSV
jgi:uncharacterized metal-binding protein